MGVPWPGEGLSGWELSAVGLVGVGLLEVVIGLESTEVTLTLLVRTGDLLKTQIHRVLVSV